MQERDITFSNNNKNPRVWGVLYIRVKICHKAGTLSQDNLLENSQIENLLRFTKPLID